MDPNAFSEAMTALVGARHGNPFAFLGLHGGRATGGGGGYCLRCFRPRAAAVSVIDAADGRVVAPMRRLHPEGVFGLDLPAGQGPFSYRLRVEEDGHVRDIDDPYRFGPVLGDLDRYLLGEGTHLEIYRKMGAHPMTVDGSPGTSFAVWAPNATRVSIIGDFNHWDGRVHPMRQHPGSGVWDIFIPGVGPGALYKFELTGPDGGLLPAKADPYAFRAEHPPLTASVVCGLGSYTWSDDAWMARRAETIARTHPISIYEVHLGSWRRDDQDRPLGYRALADTLIPYVLEMGFTHIELLPVSEFPFDGSWGYQPIGLFAPTSRFGSPDDFRYFVDRCHQAGLGVILDWVAGHFPEDAHGLAWFDGSHLYEHADPRQGRHMDWGTLIFNYGRNEVRNFLLANALFWLDQFHIDGLRVDAVASMLYLDYSREEGQWVPNKYGGRENLEAIDFLRQMNTLVYERFPGAVTIAEESTSWPMVSRPVYLGGLGFGYKWNMGWMNDTLGYVAHEPIHRRYHQNDLTFGLLYAFSENFILPLSHDEVVHGKRSILGRMPGDAWQQFATLRAYYAFMWTHPGKKLLFMGSEFGQGREWNHATGLDWHLLNIDWHQGVHALVRDLNHLYRDLPALHERDTEGDGFAWVDCTDADQSVISFLRAGDPPAATKGDTIDSARGVQPLVLVVCSFTPVVRHGYRLGVPRAGVWDEVLNTDSGFYGGSNVGNGFVETEAVSAHGHAQSLALTLPPLATIVLRFKG
ncbi:1,4-alpha-glucan branching protein GlgB [Pararhodospirillum photometricum]|uniref:1,4-alpha-glucan branching enzyme GlgB n=1 Tax=Pararhodospirillum photometricum DSM 122 TaxID=1150469 RepID=H6SRY3_PARPM|nr:1,4-alpha-glucan branching protein GlgB [Pararhodospirillum photometricum]CCG07662.1 1,4-alpha-glucan-branching enzyme [Pararhodospirillum photometricum DSM 122]